MPAKIFKKCAESREQISIFKLICVNINAAASLPHGVSDTINANIGSSACCKLDGV